MIAPERVEVRLVLEGEPREYRPKRSMGKRTIQDGRLWHVLVDGVVVGSIAYGLVTRESRTPGRMYVNSRWESPAWRYTDSEEHSPYGRRFLEVTSRKQAVENILWRHEQKQERA